MLNLPLSLPLPLIFLLVFTMNFFFIELHKSPQESPAIRAKARLIARHLALPTSDSGFPSSPNPSSLPPAHLPFINPLLLPSRPSSSASNSLRPVQPKTPPSSRSE
jgi:hypothetical protein